MIDAIVIILLLALLAILLPVGSMWRSLKLLVDRASRPKPGNQIGDCTAISVNASPECCHSARLTAGKRYESSEAPGLPLPDCTQEHCSCTYDYHSEHARPHGERRRGSPRGQRILQLNNAWMGISRSRRGSKQRNSKGAVRIS